MDHSDCRAEAAYLQARIDAMDKQLTQQEAYIEGKDKIMRVFKDEINELRARVRQLESQECCCTVVIHPCGLCDGTVRQRYRCFKCAEHGAKKVEVATCDTCGT